MADAKKLSYHCPKCDKQGSVEAQFAGKRINCPRCNGTIRIRESAGSKSKSEVPSAESEAGNGKLMLLVGMGLLGLLCFVLLCIVLIVLAVPASRPPEPIRETPVVVAAPPVEPAAEQPLPPILEEVKLLTKEPMVGMECAFALTAKPRNNGQVRFQFRPAESQQGKWQDIEGDRVTYRPTKQGKLHLEFAAIEDPTPKGGGAPQAPGAPGAPGSAKTPAPADKPIRSLVHSLEWEIAPNPWADWTALPSSDEVTGTMIAFSPKAALLLAGGGSQPLSLIRTSNGTHLTKFIPRLPLSPPEIKGEAGPFGGNNGPFGKGGPQGPRENNTRSTFAALFTGDGKASKMPVQVNQHAPDVKMLHSLAYSPGGSYVAGGYQNLVQLWRAVDGRREATIIPPSAGNVISLAFSPNEQLLAGCSAEGGFWVYSLKNQTLVQSGGENAGRKGFNPFDRGSGLSARKLAFSPENDLLACATAQGGIQVFRLPDLELEWQHNEFGEAVHSLVFSHKGNLLASGRHREISIFDVTKKALVGRILDTQAAKGFGGGGPVGGGPKGFGGGPFGAPPGGFGPQQQPKEKDHFEVGNAPTGVVSAMSFSSDDRVLAATRGGAEVAFYRTSDGLLVQSLTVRPNPIRDLIWAKSSNLLAVSGTNGRVQYWSAPNLKTPPVMPEVVRVSSGVYPELRAGQRGTLEVAVAPTDLPVKFQYRRGEEQWQDAANGKIVVEQQKAGMLRVEVCALVGDERFPPNSVSLTVEEDIFANWGKIAKHVTDTQGEVTCLTHDPRDKVILAGYADGWLRLWSKEDKPVWEKQEEKKARILSVAIHPSGERAATCAKDGLVRFWDLDKSGNPARTTKLDKDVGAKVAFFPDGSYRNDDSDSKADSIRKVAVCGTQTGAVFLAHSQPRPSSSRSKHLQKGAVVWIATRSIDKSNPLILTASTDGNVTSRNLYDEGGETVHFGDSLRHFDAANGFVATVGQNAREIRLWQQTQSHTITVPDDVEITSLALRPDGMIVVAGTNKGMLYYWRTRDQLLLREDRDLGGPVVCLDFDKTGTRLAVGVGQTIQVQGVTAAK